MHVYSPFAEPEGEGHKCDNKIGWPGKEQPVFDAAAGTGFAAMAGDIFGGFGLSYCFGGWC